MAPSFLPKNAFLLPTPIAPKLVALGLDSKTAASLSKVYISAAFNLKEVCEAEYICACNAIVFTSEDRGHSSKELRSKLLTVAVARYMQVLSKWGEEATSRAKASLLQRDRKVVPEPEVSNDLDVPVSM
ncbi:hypothetical protein BDM02DRAFT_3129015 [Thelephora ganbajun]|uniref:Uncharacterized protein n=1 Tax=Thelephora ganbajun TaxID=370292 RepID=A0ACB6ZFG5_THEGA|nr:hypothetical protein BDM02DRAFT_3129015 [Thelephora ganbajun]